LRSDLEMMPGGDMTEIGEKVRREGGREGGREGAREGWMRLEQ